MRNKLSIITISLLTTMLLSGCCLQHEFSEATCTQPSTCVKCGEVQGEALGHEWVEADCETPETCSVCGEIRGEALGHIPDMEANYQDESTCTVCGKVLEEALVPTFEEAGIKISSNRTDDVINYNTLCYDDNTLTTSGTMTVTDFEVLDGNENLEALDGYKWVKYCVNLEFKDDNAWEYGASWGFRFDDYYNPIVVDDSFASIAEEDPLAEFEALTTTLNWHGKDYDKVLLMNDPDVKKPYTYEWKDKVLEVKLYRAVRVPEGYDGIVISAINKKYESDLEYITDLKTEDAADYASVRLPAAN